MAHNYQDVDGKCGDAVSLKNSSVIDENILVKNEYSMIPGKQQGKPRAIVLDSADTVGVILDDVKSGESIQIIGMATGTITAAEAINFGHKIALYDHKKGNVVKKYSEVIGCATVDFPKGSWVHLHNLISSVDHYLIKRIHIGGGKTE